MNRIWKKLESCTAILSQQIRWFRRWLFRDSGKNDPVPAAQPGQKYHFATVLFCQLREFP